MQISARLVVNRGAEAQARADPTDSHAPSKAVEKAGMSLRFAVSSSEPGFAEALTRLLAYADDVDAEVEASAAAILADVRRRGDAAVLEYTRRFDGIAASSLAELEVSPADLRAALAGLPAAQRAALEAAAARICAFHERQLEVAGRSWLPRRRWQPVRPEGDAARPRRITCRAARRPTRRAR
jgi:hypothetical protein